MATDTAPTHPSAAPSVPPSSGLPGGGADHDDVLVEDDLLVEEISIDGMCGVY